MEAFIQAQEIFPPDAPQGCYDKLNEKDMKIAFLAEGIDKKSRAIMIEKREKIQGG